MKKYLIQSILVVSAVSALCVAKFPTFANDKQVNTQGDRVLLSQQNSEVKAAIEQLTLDWIDGWSPGAKPFDTSALQPLYAQGENALLVYDDIGEEVAVIRSWDEYAQTWQPFMEQFAYWSIQPEGEIEITAASEDMVVSNFVYIGEARDRDGKKITPKQYATLVWQKQDGNWVIVHEHLTSAAN